MKKRYVWLVVAAALLLTVTVGSTLAYLITSSNRVENVFTVGNVNITLTETTGTEYKMAPGVTIQKDPTVTVQAQSEDCWLFVKVEKSANFDNFCTFDIQDGWLKLNGTNDVYFQKLEKSAVNRMFKVLKNDRVFIKDTLTEEQLDAITEYPTLNITAYAIQSDGVDSANDAWQNLNH